MTATAVQYASTASASVSGTWTGVNATSTNRVIGAPDGLTTTGSSTGSGASVTYRATGYTPQTTIGTPSRIESVDVTVFAWVDNPANYASASVTLENVSTAVATSQSLTLSSTVGFSQTLTFTGVEWDEIATPRVSVSFTRAATITSDTPRVDAIGMVVNYTTGPVVYVGQGGNSSSTTSATSFTVSTGARVVGELAVLRMALRAGSALSLNVSDTGGHTWALLASNANPLNGQTYLYAAQITTAGTHTITVNSATSFTRSVITEAFWNASTVVHGTGTGAATSSTRALSAFNGSDGDLILAAFSSQGSAPGTITATGFNPLSSSSNTSVSTQASYRVLTAAETISFSGTATSTTYGGVGVSLANVNAGATVDAALSGSGTLAATAIPGLTASPGSTGSGSLGSSATPALTVGAEMASSGTLSASSTSTQDRDAALAGAGTLSATTSTTMLVEAAVSGSGSLQAGTDNNQSSSAPLSGSGTLTATTSTGSPGPSVTRSVSLSGSGTLTAKARRRKGSLVETKSAALSGSGVLRQSNVPHGLFNVSLSGSGILTATSIQGKRADASLGGSGTLTATAAPGNAIQAAMAGSGSLVGVRAAISLTTEAAVSGSGALGASSSQSLSVSRSLTGRGALTATAHMELELDVVLGGSGSLTAVGIERGPRRNIEINILSVSAPRVGVFSAALHGAETTASLSDDELVLVDDVRGAISTSSVRGSAVTVHSLRSRP